jgi:hypothetical protein
MVSRVEGNCKSNTNASEATPGPKLVGEKSKERILGSVVTGLRTGKGQSQKIAQLRNFQSNTSAKALAQHHLEKPTIFLWVFVLVLP